MKRIVVYVHTHTHTHARARLYVTLGLSDLGSNLGKECIFGRKSVIVNNLVKTYVYWTVNHCDS